MKKSQKCISPQGTVCFGLWHTLIASLLILIAFSHKVLAEDDVYKVKAAYIYQFSKFIHWPQGKMGSLIIGVVGSPDVFNAFSSIDGKSTNHGIIQVKSISDYEKAVDCCHMIFLAGQKQSNMSAYLDKIKDQPVVSILDTEFKPDKSAIISFVQRGTKLKFTVNLDRSKQNGVTFDSHLLGVAVNVYK